MSLIASSVVTSNSWQTRSKTSRRVSRSSACASWFILLFTNCSTLPCVFRGLRIVGLFSVLMRCEPVRSHLPSAFHGFQHGDFIGVFNVAAYRNAHSDTRNFGRRTLALDLLGEVNRGGLAFHGGIGGENDLIYLATLQALQQILNAQMLRADSVQRRKGAVQDVIDAIKVARLLDGGNVGGLFHHSHQALVAGRIAAIDARINIGNVVAQRAQA